MSNCTVIQNITTTLQNKGLIDDKFNIIGNIKDVFPYIDKLNEHARTKYGATEDLVLTKSIPSRLGANATVKVRFNHKVGQYIDSIKKMVDFQSRNNEEGNYVESSSEDFESEGETFKSSLNDDENDVEGAPEIKDSLENLRLPITDNFGELLTYKKAQLNELNREIKKLSSNSLRGSSYYVLPMVYKVKENSLKKEWLFDDNGNALLTDDLMFLMGLNDIDLTSYLEYLTQADVNTLTYKKYFTEELSQLKTKKRLTMSFWKNQARSARVPIVLTFEGSLKRQPFEKIYLQYKNTWIGLIPRDLGILNLEDKELLK